MDEDEFFAQYPMPPWTYSDFQRESGALARALPLSAELWGDPETLRRRLLAAFPEVPAGLGLPELRVLERLARLGLRFGDRRAAQRIPKGSMVIINGRPFTLWEARYEIVRRAIEFLEGQ